MSYEDALRSSGARPVSDADVDTRAAFILRTYLHVFGAMLLFTGIEIALFTSGVAEPIAMAMLSVPWILVLGGFIVVGWLATRAAHTVESPGLQYLALTGFVAAEALIFVPLLWIANMHAEGIIESAALVTLMGFVGLTMIAFVTRKDFSFLRGILFWGGICALLLIVGGAIFGFHLGLYFSIAMVALAGGSILYDTSNILHHYPENRHVGASLELFASVALLFWYVLRIFLSRR
jgi:FtsH-binding integral membrane protein